MPKRVVEEAKASSKATRKAAAKVAPLPGGNPQIAKADGDAPLQACIAAKPVGKRALGRPLAAVIVSHSPSPRKGVKWNPPPNGPGGRAAEEIYPDILR